MLVCGWNLPYLEVNGIYTNDHSPDSYITFYDKNMYVLFNKQPSFKWSYVKNDVKIKQLAKQPPTLKTLMQQVLIRLCVKNFVFSILSSRKLNFFTTILDLWQLNCVYHSI